MSFDVCPKVMPAGLEGLQLAFATGCDQCAKTCSSVIITIHCQDGLLTIERIHQGRVIITYGGIRYCIIDTE